MDWLSAAVVLVLCNLRTVEADACDSNPCQAGGICTEDAGQVTCRCPDSYTGEFCEIGPDDGYWFLLPESGSDKLYYVSPDNEDTRKTGPDAKAACEDLGGQLALVLTDDVGGALLQTLTVDGWQSTFLIGLTRSGDAWVWCCDNIQSSYLPWFRSNEPVSPRNHAVLDKKY